MPLLLALTSLALAAPPDLAAWATRTGLPLQRPATGAVQQTPDGLALVGAGESLLLADGSGPAALDAALAAMWAPFVASGIARPTPTDAPCAVGPTPATCRSASLEVAPGATLHLLAGQPADADWLLVCLDRAPERPGACAGLLEQRP